MKIENSYPVSTTGDAVVCGYFTSLCEVVLYEIEWTNDNLRAAANLLASLRLCGPPQN